MLRSSGTLSFWGANGRFNSWRYPGRFRLLAEANELSIVDVWPAETHFWVQYDNGEMKSYQWETTYYKDSTSSRYRNSDSTSGNQWRRADMGVGGISQASQPPEVQHPQQGQLPLAITSNGGAYAALLMVSPCRAGYSMQFGASDVRTALRDDYQQMACSVCRPGTAQPLAAQLECDLCPPGRFTGTEGQTHCQRCEPGTYQETPGASQCTKCAAGKFLNSYEQKEERACLYCPAGKAQPSPGSTTCVDCPLHTYTGIGEVECKVCPKGFDCSDGSLIACPPGKYSSGRTECLTCSRGHRCPGAAFKIECGAGTRDSPETGFDRCAQCEAGKYQPNAGATNCLDCTPGYYCAEGAPAALPCPGGTHKNTSISVMTSVMASRIQTRTFPRHALLL